MMCEQHLSDIHDQLKGVHLSTSESSSSITSTTCDRNQFNKPKWQNHRNEGAHFMSINALDTN